MRLTILAVAALLVLGLAAGASAGTIYVGVNGGYSHIPTINMKTLSVAGAPEEEEEGGGPFEPECAAVGGKLGYWMDSLPWLAVEFNVWHTWTDGTDESLGDLDISLLNFSGSLLFQKLWECWRAYAGGGLLLTRAELDNGASDSDFAAGAMAQVGGEYLFLRHWAAFAEYRYSWNSFKFEDIDRKFHIDRHEFLAGVNFRF